MATGLQQTGLERVLEGIGELTEQRTEQIRNAITALLRAQLTQEPLPDAEREFIESLRAAERATIEQALKAETENLLIPEPIRPVVPPLMMDDAVNQINVARNRQCAEGLLEGLQHEPKEIQKALRRRLIALFDPKNIKNYLTPEHWAYEIIDLDLRLRISGSLSIRRKYRVCDLLEIKESGKERRVELKGDLDLRDKEKEELMMSLIVFGIPFGRPLTEIEIETLAKEPLFLMTDEEKDEAKAEAKAKDFPRRLGMGVRSLELPHDIMKRQFNALISGGLHCIGDLIEIDLQTGKLELVNRIGLIRGIGPQTITLLQERLKYRDFPIGEIPTPEQKEALEAFKGRRR